jgi:hypothetical protein
MTWLKVTLPRSSASLRVGELTLAGPCIVSFDKTPPLLKDATALDPATAYVQFRGARFTELTIYQGYGWGHLAEAAMFEGTQYNAGALVRFGSGQAAGEK